MIAARLMRNTTTTKAAQSISVLSLLRNVFSAGFMVLTRSCGRETGANRWPL
jgi:hypothetical protein